MPKPAKTPGPTDGDIYRRALGIGLVGVALAALLSALEAGPAARVSAFFGRFATPHARAAGAPAADAPTHLEPMPLTDELRKKGFHECFPPDPIGLGPYAPFKNLSMGRIAIPQRGGHTADMGYDVLIQFHGHSPVRKTLVQVARGMVYVGIDKGLGSGPYSDAFANPDVFKTLLGSIEAQLKRYSDDPRAHIRHLALSAWSAGYGAVNEILKYGDERVDAVVLLDGLHAAWNPAARSHDAGVSSLSSLPLTPTFRFAKKAAAGEKIFLFTHSEVDPETYPSTRLTADLLLHELGLTRTPIDPGNERFGQTGTVDEKGFHLWSFRGSNEEAHCSHISHITRALWMLEDAWQTPPMDRNVPFTPAPILGAPGAGSELEAALDVDAGTGALAVVTPPGSDPNPIAAALVPAKQSEELLPQPAPRADTPAPAVHAPPPADEPKPAPTPDERLPRGEE